MPDPDALAHQRIKVDEDAVAKQVVDLVLADPVASGEPEQSRLLVGGVVIDVHVRIPLATLTHHLQEVAQRLPFVGAVVRPQRPEVVGGVEHPEQILEPPLATVGRPQRVTLEIEEQIALVGLGQHHQRLRVGDLVGRLPVDARRELQACLRGQRFDRARGQFGDGAVVPGESADRGDARIDQAGALAGPHARDQEKVVVLADLDRALRAAEAGADVLVLPRNRRAAGQVVVEQLLKGGAAGTVDRQQFVEPVARRDAVAEHQLDVGRHRHARVGQRVGVCGQLQQGLHFHRARQLRIAQPVARPSGPSSRIRKSANPANRPSNIAAW